MRPRRMLWNWLAIGVCVYAGSGLCGGRLLCDHWLQMPTEGKNL